MTELLSVLSCNIMHLLINQCDVEPWDNSGVSVENMHQALFFKRSALSRKSVKRPYSELADGEDDGGVGESVAGVLPFSHLPFPQKKLCFRTAEGSLPDEDDTDCRTLCSPGTLLRSNMAAKDCREHSTQEWELRKDEIERLYLIEKMSLKKVMKMMRDHGFIATYVFRISPIAW
jgi:hypothetical protein